MVVSVHNTVFFLAALAACASGVWIGEQYWTSVHYDGSIEPYRSRQDFLHFRLVRNYHEVDSYIAFWITKDDLGHYEAYGQAFVATDGKLCGRFVNRTGTAEICGGFRVLSYHQQTRSNPFAFVSSSVANLDDAVTYRGRQIARIWTKQRVSSIYGGADLRERTAYGVDPNGTAIHISFKDDPTYYVNNVEILHKTYGNGNGNVQPFRRAPELIADEDLPRIYHSDAVDHRQLPDQQTYDKLHPDYHPRPY
ncbi:Protein PQN-52 a [Aphelenchoides avenae]|nr:Protein PQN-52 a [Aphelenchus avenae]